MDRNKILVRPGMLSQGDFILEVNRFNSKDYVIWKISSFDLDIDHMHLTCIRSNKYYPGYACGASIRCHTIHKNCTWLTYLLPTAKVLYGHKDRIP